MPETAEQTHQCPMCGQACSAGDYAVVREELRAMQQEHQREICELQAELAAAERALDRYV